MELGHPCLFDLFTRISILVTCWKQTALLLLPGRFIFSYCICSDTFCCCRPLTVLPHQWSHCHILSPRFCVSNNRFFAACLFMLVHNSRWLVTFIAVTDSIRQYRWIFALFWFFKSLSVWSETESVDICVLTVLSLALLSLLQYSATVQSTYCTCFIAVFVCRRCKHYLNLLSLIE